jgi:hypothetical protein
MDLSAAGVASHLSVNTDVKRKRAAISRSRELWRQKFNNKCFHIWNCPGRKRVAQIQNLYIATQWTLNHFLLF